MSTPVTVAETEKYLAHCIVLLWLSCHSYKLTVTQSDKTIKTNAHAKDCHWVNFKFNFPSVKQLEHTIRMALWAKMMLPWSCL